MESLSGPGAVLETTVDYLTMTCNRQGAIAGLLHWRDKRFAELQEEATMHDPWQGMDTQGNAWVRLTSNLDDLAFSCTSAVNTLSDIGAMLPSMPLTSPDWTWRLLLGQAMALAISLETATKLLSDYHRGAAGDLPLPSSSPKTVGIPFTLDGA